ncbi:hypothetical protein FH972_026543 [Carpinus fangiana]|uniref:Prion-inhibition and propagation HeLo domain-containing protein n=1 Tax=Carpinus fangiana TaxID=176857 RepID=A0A5N6L6T4_9ROSI|nr:hypothetical protein FH972_026543 [Carpinus fangiana]
MEGVAFAVGVAALFSAILDVFDFVIKARKATIDFTTLNSLLNSHKLRFYIFGLSYGMIPGMAGQKTEPDPRLQPQQIARVIEDNIHSIFALLQEAQHIVSIYSASHGNVLPTALITMKQQRGFRRVGRSMVAFFRRQRSRSFGVAAATWSVHHRERFDTITSRIGELVTGLYDITSSLDLLERQRIVLEQEISSTSDTESLRVIRHIASNLDQALSIRAGERLEGVISGRPSFEHPGSSGIGSSLRAFSFESARSEMSSGMLHSHLMPNSTPYSVIQDSYPTVSEVLGSQPPTELPSELPSELSSRKL